MQFHLFTLNASHAHHALSIRCLANALRDAGFRADYSEANLKDRSHAVLAALIEKNADVYGFSCYIWNVEPMLKLAADIKALRPDCRVLLGGPEVSFDTDRFTALPFVDCVLCGEGEESIVAAATRLEKGEQLPSLLIGTPYTAFTKRGIHYENDPDLSGLLYYESSRGCPFSCAFCLSGSEGNDPHAIRAKSAEDTLADLLEFERFSAPITIKLVDRTFNFNKERAKMIWRGLLDPRYTKCYHFEIAANLLDEDSFAILAQFPKNKIRLEIGLQSTNQATLAAINRHADTAKILAAAKRLTDMGNCHIHLDLIAGLPYENYTSFARSFDAAYFCCNVLQLGFLKLLHGTSLRREATKYGMVAEANPPYTVLKTDAISFAQLEKLHAISDLCERLRDSNRFTRTLALLLPDCFTPFAFYQGFADYLINTAGKAVQKISQRDLFLYLSSFAKQILPIQTHWAISEALRADFACAEVRRPPQNL
ncbi:MAG: DUF4080 domain-containing protein [Ruminococcaceae bacterium]|nr:DUF4080 domain-containing protein [Oscillospiraceae bacterium]